MRKTTNLVKMPTSKFARIMCRKCRNEQVIFTKIATVVVCQKCGEEIARPGGGEAIVHGKVLEIFG